MSTPLLLFAHGAGAGSSHPWMQAWAERLSAFGRVVTFDYPYVREGRKRPDRLPKLLAAHREALVAARADHDGPVVLVGKSMGSRVGCHLANEADVDVDALVCLGYPLQSPGKKKTVRDEVLLALDTPILFVQGTRDRLCPLDLLSDVRARMTAPSDLHVVEEGDHSLRITKRHTKATGETQEDADAAALDAVRAFVEGVS
ncbi:MAG: alpha/beta fold hydrolase [Myxococcota bacterium]